MVAKIVSIGDSAPGSKRRAVRFENERWWLVNHQNFPNVVKMNQVLETKNHAFFFMEKVQGKSLEEFILNNRNIPVDVVRDMFLQLLNTVKVS